MSHPQRIRGLTLLEVMVSVALLTAISLPALFYMLKSAQLSRESDLQGVARLAAESELARLRALPFDELASRADGHRFAVRGLPPRAGANAENGVVRVFLDESDVDNPALPPGATTCDLDGNPASADALSPTSRYRALPVRIEIRWPDSSGGEVAYTLPAVIAPDSDFLRRRS